MYPLIDAEVIYLFSPLGNMKFPKSAFSDKGKSTLQNCRKNSQMLFQPEIN